MEDNVTVIHLQVIYAKATATRLFAERNPAWAFSLRLSLSVYAWWLGLPVAPPTA